MKKLIFLLIIIFAASVLFMYYQYDNKFLLNLDDNKVYKIKNINTLDFEDLDNVSFYKDGIITYNSQTIKYIDFNNNIIWENKNNMFSNKVFVVEEYIFRALENALELINVNNESYVMTEI